MTETYYPAHSSLPVRVHGAEDMPRRVHEAEPKEYLNGLDIWDNTELSSLEAWREWFNAGGENSLSAAWTKVECIECELGRRCLRRPRCEGVCRECGYADCECAP